MTTSARVAFATLISLVYLVASVSIAGEEAGVDAKVAFARLKTLKGEWKTSSEGEHHGAGKVVFSVTAAGTTLMETQYPGTAHEMITMYHLDGDDLRLTHYCAAGNQPRLKLDRKASKADDFTFVFDGGTNLDPSKDVHIHGVRIKFVEDGKVQSQWDGYMDGKQSECVKITLTRP